MEIQIEVAKTIKYATSESGDTVEVVERPNGGMSVVLSDGQTSGRGAKAISNLVVRKVISLLAEGVRDGAAARAASDYLYTERGGKVSASLNILSADFQTGTLVITRNNPVPVYVAQGDKIECLSSESQPIGTTRNLRPAISELQLTIGTSVIMYTDGLVHAGDRFGQSLDICTLLNAFLEEQNPTSHEIANSLLAEAIRVDQGRPNDDMSVAVLRVLEGHDDQIRQMTLRLPVPRTATFV
jgi:serine phosphatase RsbU (regulator of sigma subunit)